MKKFIFMCFASFAFMQSVYAIPAALEQSQLYYEAILASPLLEQVVGVNEFIVDIERESKRNFAVTEKLRVRYIIRTISGAKDRIEKSYLATLIATPNKAIGPPVITVKRIVPLKK